MKAAVHTNGSLTILPQLFEPGWGRQQFPTIAGTCMILQAIYAVELQTGIPAARLAGAIRERGVYAGNDGLTLAQIADIFKPLLGKRQLGGLRHKTVQNAIASMKQGGTVVGIVSGFDYINPDCADERGILDPRDVLESKGPGWHTLHSLMIAGADEGEGMLIFRESRPKHAYETRGYFKVPIAPLIKNKKAAAYVELVVH